MKKVMLTKFYGGVPIVILQRKRFCAFAMLKCFGNPSSRVLQKYLDWGDLSNDFHRARVGFVTSNH